jgi:hypothetical protein
MVKNVCSFGRAVALTGALFVTNNIQAMETPEATPKQPTLQLIYNMTIEYFNNLDTLSQQQATDDLNTIHHAICLLPTDQRKQFITEYAKIIQQGEPAIDEFKTIANRYSNLTLEQKEKIYTATETLTQQIIDASPKKNQIEQLKSRFASLHEACMKAAREKSNGTFFDGLKKYNAQMYKRCPSFLGRKNEKFVDELDIFWSLFCYRLEDWLSFLS